MDDDGIQNIKNYLYELRKTAGVENTEYAKTIVDLQILSLIVISTAFVADIFKLAEDEGISDDVLKNPLVTIHEVKRLSKLIPKDIFDKIINETRKVFSMDSHLH